MENDSSELDRVRAAAAPASQPQPDGCTRAIAGYGADRVVQRVAELPDRTSPDDWPDALLVTAAELKQIVSEEMAQLGLGAVPASPW